MYGMGNLDRFKALHQKFQIAYDLNNINTDYTVSKVE